LNPASALLALLALADPAAVRQLFDAAAAALAKGDYDRAQAGFEQVLKAEPRNVGALGNLGVVYSRREQFDKAAAAYRKALEIAPGDPGLLVNLGLALLKQERYADARAPLEKLIRIQPAHRQGRELAATARLYAGDAVGALSLLETLEPSPGVWFLLALANLKTGKRAEAAAAFERLESALGREQAAFLRGKACYESGLFDEAARELEPVAAALPEARRELGKVYVSLRRGEEAEATFRRVLEDRPGDPESAYFLGALLVERGELAEGAAFLERANPGFWGTHYYLGKAALKRRASAEALRRLRLADELQPGNASVLFQLLRASQAAGDVAGAARAAERLKAVSAKQREKEQSELVLR